MALGDDTVMIVKNVRASASVTSADALGIARVALDGQITMPVTNIALGQLFTSYDVVRRGPDVIVAWLGGRFPAALGSPLARFRIGVARVTP